MRIAILILGIFVFACNSKKTEQRAEEWELSRRSVYRYVLDDQGRLDTLFTKTYQYTRGSITDSMMRFVAMQYNGKLPVEETHYLLDKGGTPKVIFRVKLGYSAEGYRQTARYEKDGLLVREEAFVYGDSNQIKANIFAQSRLLPNVSDQAFIDLPANAIVAKSQFDTLQVLYLYDSTKKITGTINTDSRGGLVSKNINVYSGNDPLSSHMLSNKGDTLQRTDFKPNGKEMLLRQENDSFILVQATRYGYVFEEIVAYKKRSEKRKTTNSWDERGRKVEERVYVVKAG